MSITNVRHPHVMIDSETLGTRPGCVIMSIGVITFKPWLWAVSEDMWAEDMQKLKLHVTRQSCLDAGLVINPSTEDWWAKQSDEARADAFGNKDKEIPLLDACNAVRDFILGIAEVNGTYPGRVWCQGLTFDLPILAEAMHRVGVKEPWHHRYGRDTRSVYEEAGIDYSGIYHEPIRDCIAQAAHVSEAKTIIARAMGREVV